MQLSELPEFDCLLITQSLDDHCHLKTLRPLSKKSPNIKVIATPNAKTSLDPLFSNVSRSCCGFSLCFFLLSLKAKLLNHVTNMLFIWSKFGQIEIEI